MRPHRALFHLVLRHTVWKVLLLLLLLAAAQWSAFLCLSPDPASIGLAAAFSLSGGRTGGAFGLGLSAAQCPASAGHHRRGARCPGYTLARLPLSPGWVVFWAGGVQHPGLSPVLGGAGPGPCGDRLVLRPARGLLGHANPLCHRLGTGPLSLLPPPGPARAGG